MELKYPKILTLFKNKLNNQIILNFDKSRMQSVCHLLGKH